MNKLGAIILVILCILLGGALFFKHSQGVKKETEAVATITQLSNEVVQAKELLAEQKQVNTSLETNLTMGAEELRRISNNLAETRSNLAKTEADAKAAMEVANAEMAKRDAKITELETQRDDLTKRMTTLNSSIVGLEGSIAETQKKLAASEGDREFLLKELKRLQSEKAELERQFNDLAMLREQVHRLKDELAVSRRLDWIRRGLYGNLKGAERLQKGLANVVKPASTNYDLNVELKQDGSVKVNSTNAAASAKPPTNAPVAK